jgi:hypothetical protein
VNITLKLRYAVLRNIRTRLSATQGHISLDMNSPIEYCLGQIISIQHANSRKWITPRKGGNPRLLTQLRGVQFNKNTTAQWSQNHRHFLSSAALLATYSMCSKYRHFLIEYVTWAIKCVAKHWRPNQIKHTYQTRNRTKGSQCWVMTFIFKYHNRAHPPWRTTCWTQSENQKHGRCLNSKS